MPELPEAETIRCQLEQTVLGKTIRRLELHHARAWRAHESPEEIQALVESRRITAVKRRGKAPYLLLKGESPSALIFRLGMTGLVRAVPANEPPNGQPYATLHLSGRQQIRFYDQRTFGELIAFPTQEVEQTPEFSHYGPEPFSEGFTLDYLTRQFTHRSAQLEDVLMNQTVVAGIGKIYADEICFKAGLRPMRRVNRLTRPMRERLWRAIPEVLAEGIECRGSSIRDELFKDVYGIPGRFQDRMMVYQRTGQPCRVCGTSIRRTAMKGSRGMHWCPKCQK
jgi:formamidopyrimidine-DNA glycosylase